MDGGLSSVIDRVFKTKLDLLEEPWSVAADNVKLADAAIDNRIVLRNQTEIDISRGVDWLVTFSENDDTNRLYLYSLSIVGSLLSTFESTKDRKYLEKAVSIFDQWIEFVGVKENRDVVGRISSSEHAASVRVHVCIKFIQVLNSHYDEYSDLKLKIINELFYDAVWLANDDNYPHTNHGTMMNIALLLASQQFKGVEEISKTWEKKVLERSEKTMKMAFSADGVSRENSVFYHFFNITLYKKLVKILHHYSIRSDFGDYADRTIKLAAMFSAAINRDDSTIPPLGDSYEKKYFTGKYVDGSWFYKDGGYVIVKEGGLYLTFKCGFTSCVHKHVDDGSITLRYNGQDIIVDAGLYNYDSTDPFRQYFVSSKAHSGIYPSKLSSSHVREYCREITKTKPYLVTFHRDDKYVYMAGRMGLWGNIDIYRRILIVLPNIIVIKDEVKSKEPTEFVQQFLFHPKMVVRKEEKGSFEIAGNGLCVQFEHHNQDSEIMQIKGAYNGNVDGWYSPAYMEKLEAPKINVVNFTADNTLYTSMFIGTGSGGNIPDLKSTTPMIDLDQYLKEMRESSDKWRIIDLIEQLEARSKNISIEPFDEKVIIRFNDLSIADNNYIQVFDGAFSKPPEKFRLEGTVPFDEGYVLVEIDLNNSSNEEMSAQLFVMQYSDTDRISSRKYNLSAATGTTRAEYCDPLEKGAAYVKLAIKFLKPMEGVILERIHLGYQPEWSRMKLR